MNEAEKYLFEVHGYLAIEGALSPREVAAANAAIDHYADQIGIRANDLAHESETLKGTQGRGDLGGMLTWDKPHCDPFRAMIAHARFKPYLEELLGPGFRLEGLGIITMDEGAEGFWFHEGGEPLDRSRGFLYRNGRMFCGMTNIAVQLADVGPEDGGFACLPGSHKANYPCPDEIRLYEAHQDRIAQIPAKAGDAILFVETLMHGGLAVDGQTPAALGDFALQPRRPSRIADGDLYTAGFLRRVDKGAAGGYYAAAVPERRQGVAALQTEMRRSS